MKKYSKNLIALALIAIVSFSTQADIKENNTWLISGGFSKSLIAEYSDDFIEEDLNTNHVRLGLEYKTNNKGRYGIEIDRQSFKSKEGGDSITATGINFVMKYVAGEGKARPYFGSTLGLYSSSDYVEDENLLGFGVGIGVGGMFALNDNLELDIGLKYNTLIVEQVNYCSYYYCYATNPVTYDVSAGIGLNYHF